MKLREETITFFVFIIVGIIIGIIFDFFRALRKTKKYNDRYINIQDILFFIIIGVVLAVFLIYNLEDVLRLYLFLAVFLGIVIYYSTISIYTIKILIKIINIWKSIVCFVFFPFIIYKVIFMTIFDFLNKKSKKYCNKFYNVISYFCKSVKLKANKIK